MLHRVEMELEQVCEARRIRARKKIKFLVEKFTRLT